MDQITFKSKMLRKINLDLTVGFYKLVSFAVLFVFDKIYYYTHFNYYQEFIWWWYKFQFSSYCQSHAYTK